MSRTEVADTDEPRDTDDHATDRRTFLGALGASSLPLGLGSGGTAMGRQDGTRTVDPLPWTESFDLADGATDDNGETAWQLEDADTHPGVAVDSKALRFAETDGTATWRSEPIDISGADTVELTVTVRGHGNFSTAPADPPAVAGSEPTDPDDDGVYEDLNGNGQMDYDDVVTMFNKKDNSAVADHPRAYDINCNDDVNYADVVALSDEVGGDDEASADCEPGSDTMTVAYVVDDERTVVDRRADVASDGETIEATEISGESLLVEVSVRTPDPETAYHVAEVSVTQPDDAAPDETTFVADRAPDGSRLTSRPDGPAYHTNEGTTHLFTWDEPGPGARAVIYDEDERTDWGGGPDIHIYDRLERPGAEAGDKPSKLASRGQWSHYSSYPDLRSDSHSGEFAARVQNQNTINKLRTVFEPTTEVFLSYCVKIPDGKAMPGTEEPGELPELSVWKMTWLYNEDVGARDDDVDICLPSWSGGQKASVGGNNLDPSLSIPDPAEWWQFGEWLRFSFWLESGPDPDDDPGRIRWQVVTEGEETQVVAENTTPVMAGGQAPFAWKRLNIPGWAENKQVSGDNVEALYDDIYVATGDDSNARVELSDDADYGASTRIQLCDIRSWASNRVSATLSKGSLDSVEGATLHLTTADETQAVSMEVS